MRILSSIILSALLLILHVNQAHKSLRTVHTYVPPLTHTPGIGLSMIGSHSDPPFTLLESMQQHMPTNLNRTMSGLFQEHKVHLDEGVRLRLQMQAQTEALLKLLPPSFVHQAWEERSQHEARIGELTIWTELHNRTK